MTVQEFDIRELQNRAEEPGKIHFVVHLGRPGARLFSVYLEYTHYSPRTPRNEEFTLNIVRWPAELGLIWEIITIPEEDMALAEDAAKESGLVIKESIPMMLGGGKEERFPMSSPSVYSLESNPKSQVYKGKAEEIREAESKMIKRIFEEDEQKHREELKSQGLTDDQIEIMMQEINNE